MTSHIYSKFSNVIWLCFLVVNGSEFDYTKYNFCDNLGPCVDTSRVLTACDKYCKNNENIEEYLDKRVEMRRYWLEKHNGLRQKVASGAEKDPHLGTPNTAANMNALSYDLITEHLCRCWLHSKYGIDPQSREPQSYYDDCSWHPKTKTPAGQILGWDSIEYDLHTNMKRQDKVFDFMYNEVKNLPSPDVIDRTNRSIPDSGESHYGHFTSLMWATMTHVGCASGIVSKNALKFAKTQYVTSLCCDYVSYAAIKDHGQTLNAEKQPVFQRGPPCSNCSAGRKCNIKYNALCGEIAPIPTESLMPLQGSVPRAEADPKKSTGLKLAPTLLAVLTCAITVLVFEKHPGPA